MGQALKKLGVDKIFFRGQDLGREAAICQALRCEVHHTKNMPEMSVVSARLVPSTKRKAKSCARTTPAAATSAETATANSTARTPGSSRPNTAASPARTTATTRKGGKPVAPKTLAACFPTGNTSYDTAPPAEFVTIPLRWTLRIAQFLSVPCVRLYLPPTERHANDRFRLRPRRLRC